MYPCLNVFKLHYRSIYDSNRNDYSNSNSSHKRCTDRLSGINENESSVNGVEDFNCSRPINLDSVDGNSR